MRRYEVVIPVRNGGQPLVNSIRSVLSCANSGELLLTLSDNFSTDGTPWKKVLEDFPKDAWRIISPADSLGRVEHWTWAFAQAQLPWVKPLMVGDMIENSFWTWVSEAIAAHPNAGLFFSGDHTIDPGKAHPDVKSEQSAEELATSLYSYDDFMRDAVDCHNRIGALSRALMRADITRQSLPFEPEYPWTADWRFCKRFLQRAPAVQTPAPLVSLTAAFLASARRGKEFAEVSGKNGTSRLNRLHHPARLRHALFRNVCAWWVPRLCLCSVEG